MEAERPISLEGIEDMIQKLTSAIEDFDRAVMIQTLSLTKEQGITAKENGEQFLDLAILPSQCFHT
jgi:hypothetical protein